MVNQNKSVRLSIAGKVQGVYYRNWTVTNARQFNLSGWVRNRLDGSVEAVLCGEEHQVLTMIDACWQGPSAARVDSIQIEDCAPPPGSDFKKLPTA